MYRCRRLPIADVTDTDSQRDICVVSFLFGLQSRRYLLGCHSVTPAMQKVSVDHPITPPRFSLALSRANAPGLTFL